MSIRFARIDDRLIHGQVATAWTKFYQLERLIVVSDVVAHDQLRKFLLREAAPPGVSVDILSVKQAIALREQMRMSTQKIALLFTNPQDVVALIGGGFSLPTINLGGMSFQVGKKMITHFVSVDQMDIQAFQFLAQQNVELEIRKVPTDRKVFLMDLLDKEVKN